MNNYELENIEVLRKQLCDMVRQKGYTHPDTVSISQLLDKCLNQIGITTISGASN